MIPLAGQGKPLPADFPYKGEWLLEHRMFLYRADASRGGDGAAPQFTAAGPSSPGSFCFGFDVEQLAAALNMESDKVFEANRDGSLILIGTAEVPPTQGGTAAKQYGFRCGDNEGSLTIEVDGRSGQA